jgi:hypothetical protein
LIIWASFLVIYAAKNMFHIFHNFKKISSVNLINIKKHLQAKYFYVVNKSGASAFNKYQSCLNWSVAKQRVKKVIIQGML